MNKRFFLAFLFALTGVLSIEAQNDKNKKDNSDNDSYSKNNWNWGGKRVKGTGPVVTETRNVSDFTGVESSISADIILKQSPTFKVKVEGQKNILDLLKTELKGTSLKISFEKGYSLDYNSNLKIYVEAPDFEKLGMSGSGNVSVQGSLSGDKLSIGISGSGDFDLDNIKYDNLDLGISGSGDVTMSGSAGTVNMRISGSGDIKAADLKAQSVQCQVSGSGDITCNAQKSLDAMVSGSGDIRYKGKPESVKTRVSGSGDIESY